LQMPPTGPPDADKSTSIKGIDQVGMARRAFPGETPPIRHRRPLQWRNNGRIRRGYRPFELQTRCLHPGHIIRKPGRITPLIVRVLIRDVDLARNYRKTARSKRSELCRADGAMWHGPLEMVTLLVEHEARMCNIPNPLILRTSPPCGFIRPCWRGSPFGEVSSGNTRRESFAHITGIIRRDRRIGQRPASWATNCFADVARHAEQT